jgi:hypothetical protein
VPVEEGEVEGCTDCGDWKFYWWEGRGRRAGRGIKREEEKRLYDDRLYSPGPPLSFDDDLMSFPLLLVLAGIWDRRRIGWIHETKQSVDGTGAAVSWGKVRGEGETKVAGSVDEEARGDEREEAYSLASDFLGVAGGGAAGVDAGVVELLLPREKEDWVSM